VYRFSVTANKADHKPIVVFFCLQAILLCLFLTSVWAMVFCVLVSLLAAIMVWQKIVAAHPLNGVVILDANQFRFENDSLHVQGVITAKSRLFSKSIWLYINGFSKNYWLIISANSVDLQNYTRLKRATLNAINAVETK
jgi:uncharacterized membrane protein